MRCWSRRTSPAFTAALAIGTALGLSGCSGARAGSAEAAAPPVTVIGPENIVVLDSTEISTGPAVSGTLEPVQQAQVRAEIAGTVLETNYEEGQRVTKGALLARIDQRGVQDAYLSARAQLRSAEQTLADARRNAERSATLEKAGAIAERDLEAAQSAEANAEAAVADARARLATAERTLAYTQVRAPISGVVSARQASAGDVLQAGDPIYTIVDPSSLQLEGTVPAEQLRELTRGAPVEFTITGYPGQTFRGRIDRINPAADPATRQVRVYITIPNTDRRLVAGLFAEGRVGTEVRRGLLAPAAAVDQQGIAPTVLRLQQGRAEQVQVQLGPRDPATDKLELRGGVAAGDTVILETAGVTPGSEVRVQRLETADAKADSR
ncbi:MAG TPA: efflux RND transporter periplasmic adaptor subunit [Gemmatimonadales bacterium]|nr:efflux RND transporter periplasmic adaptor subunit [Gemmatimonadales bacterium]